MFALPKYCRLYRTFFFFECSLVKEFWKYVERRISARVSCNSKLSSKSILFGVDQIALSKEQYIIANHLILVGKMCISIFKKAKSDFALEIIFEKELLFRKLENLDME